MQPLYIKEPTAGSTVVPDQFPVGVLRPVSPLKMVVLPVLGQPVNAISVRPSFMLTSILPAAVGGGQ